MSAKILLALTSVLCCLSFEVHAEDSANVTVNWQRHCSKCHDYEGGATKIGKIVNAPDNIYEASQDLCMEDIVKIISDGKEKMPSFREKLSDKEIKNLAQHIEYSAILEGIRRKKEKLDEALATIKREYKNLPECKEVQKDWPWK